MKASIDIGTNTVRLLIVNDNLDVIEKISKIGRLGEGGKCHLYSSAIDRVIKILQYFGDDICYTKYGILPSEIKAVATSAVREADNKNQFAAAVHKKTGIKVDVITGITEGILTASGVMMRINPMRPILIVDIGGGSTEFITINKEKPATLSIPIGALKIRERFLSDPPDDMELTKAKRWINSNISDKLSSDVPSTLIAAAGTPTTLAAMMLGISIYDSSKVNGYRMKLRSVTEIIKKLSKLNSAAILKLYPVVQKGREDLLVAGALILAEIMKRYKDELIVSDEGLLEGIILSGNAGEVLNIDSSFLYQHAKLSQA